jgi:hypothetical protein
VMKPAEAEDGQCRQAWPPHETRGLENGRKPPRLPACGVHVSPPKERPGHRACQEVKESNARPVDARGFTAQGIGLSGLICERAAGYGGMQCSSYCTESKAARTAPNSPNSQPTVRDNTGAGRFVIPLMKSAPDSRSGALITTRTEDDQSQTHPHPPRCTCARRPIHRCALRGCPWR